MNKASLLILFGLFLSQVTFGQQIKKTDTLKLTKRTDSITHSIKADSIALLKKTNALKKVINDSASLFPKHSPRKATYLSLVCPGLGQIYNKKYWKVPIVYAGFGTMAYFFGANHGEYVKFKNAYNFVASGNKAGNNVPPVNDYVTRYNYDVTLLQNGRDYYRRNLELTYIITGAWYILVAVDAQVDAQFFDFDVSDRITLNVQPFIQSPTKQLPGMTGLTLSLSF
jgi:hypothetical protein